MSQFLKEHVGGILGIAVAIAGMTLLALHEGKSSNANEESAMIWFGVIIIIAAACGVGFTINWFQNNRWQPHRVAFTTAGFLVSAVAISGAVLVPWTKIEQWRPTPFNEDGGNWSHLAGMMGNFFAQLIGPIGGGLLAVAIIIVLALASGAIAYKALAR